LAEDGCHQYSPTVDLASGIAAQGELRGDVVTVVEAWESLAALQAHLIAPHMLAYREQVKEIVQGVKLQILEPC
jgi:quinol monooxygenase YgiN